VSIDGWPSLPVRQESISLKLPADGNESSGCQDFPARPSTNSAEAFSLPASTVNPQERADPSRTVSGYQVYGIERPVESRGHDLGAGGGGNATGGAPPSELPSGPLGGASGIRLPLTGEWGQLWTLL